MQILPRPALTRLLILEDLLLKHEWHPEVFDNFPECELAQPGIEFSIKRKEWKEKLKFIDLICNLFQ